MTRLLLVSVLAAALSACTPRYTTAPSGETAEFGIVRLGGDFAYLIDPRTESCFLTMSGLQYAWSTPVSCAKLKANVPGAARFITWETAASATPAK